MDFFQRQIAKGEAVLFLGAGASYNCTDLNGERIGFSGNDLLEKICIEFLGGIQSGVNLDFAATMAIQKAGRKNLDLFLKNIVDDFLPTEEHKFITLFKWKSIYTTNYDQAIEKVYADNRNSTTQNLERVICDSDPLQKILTTSDSLPLIKLHGCISRLNDDSLPLIISSENYRYHLENRSGLFQTLKEDLSNNLIIFYGYGLSDSNIIGLLDDLEKEGIKRPRHIWLDPYMDKLKKEFWSSKNLECRISSLTDFLKEIPENLSSNQQLLSIVKDDSCISRLIPSDERPSTELELYLKEQLLFTDINKDLQIEIDQYKKSLFYRGNSIGFGWVGKNLDFMRTIYSTIFEQLFVDSEIENKITNFYLIDGYAGSGKTVLLKRLAWNGVANESKPCFYLKNGGQLSVDFSIELINLLNEPVYIFIDDVLNYQSEINQIFNYCNKNRKKLFIVGTARTNEWNNSSNTLDQLNPLTFNLRDLDNQEINSLIAKLKETNSEGGLKQLPDKEKFTFIKEISNKQLLVTLLEATHYGQDFAEIIKDEYEGIYNRVAKELYLNICTLHRHGVELRAGMVKRLSGIDFENFKEEFLLPLELIVITYYSYKSNDIVYLSRHQNIAGSVYSQAFLTETEKTQNIIKIIRYLNIAYESDKIALELLLKGRYLAEEFSYKEHVYQIYKIAENIGLNKSFLFHQQAVFESSHKNGSLDLALEVINKINNDDPNYDMKIVNHTRANIYRKLAQVTTNTEDRNRYWSLGLKLLNGNIRKNNRTSSNFLTKGHILLDEIEHNSTNEENLITQINEFESNLGLGFKAFPYDEALLSLEYDYSRILENRPNTIEKLGNALLKNSDNIYILQRYAKYYIDKGDFERARKAMHIFLRNNINNKDINFLMAKSYIKEDEKKNIDTIISYIKKSYSANDSSYLNKFEHARFEFIYKDEKKASLIFEELINTSMPAAIKNKERGDILDVNGRPILYKGHVVTINQEYGFIKCSNFAENIYVSKSAISNEEDWELLNKNDPVTVTLCFTFRGPRVKKIGIS